MRTMCRDEEAEWNWTHGEVELASEPLPCADCKRPPLEDEKFKDDVCAFCWLRANEAA